VPGHIYVAPYNGSDWSYFQARRLDNSGTTNFIFRTYNSGSLIESLTIRGNGNIGIGTTNPQTTVDILSNNAGLFVRDPRDAEGAGATLRLQAGGQVQRFKFLWNDRFFIDSGEGTAEQFTIKRNGNVGIGTTNPQHRLEVSNGQTVLRGSAGSVALSIIENSSSSVGAHFTSEGANNIMFQLKRTADGLTNTELRTGGNSYINAISGNVGIGTNNPNQKLTVNGTIYGKEVKVDLQVPGPDYVFEKDYALLSLDKVQSFIAEHKHLPEVPSAKEMEANGINLSEMNLLLLKKIEELTLYQIEANKRIQKLEEAVNYLSRK